MVFIKSAAPLQVCAIRRIFFAPAPLDFLKETCSMPIVPLSFNQESKLIFGEVVSVSQQKKEARK